MSENKPTSHWNFRRSLAFRYLVIVSVIFLAGQLLLSTLLGFTTYRQQLESLTTKVAGQSEFLSSVIPEPLLRSDFILLETFMKQSSQDPDIVYSVILNEQGKPLTRYLNQDNSLIAAALENNSNGTGILAVIETVRQTPTMREVHVPIIINGTLLAEVWLGYSIDSAIQNSVRTGLTTVALSLLASALLVWVTVIQFNRQISTPLQSLTETALALAAGDRNKRSSLNRMDEIGSLSNAFNSMAEDLQQVLENLEQRVADRIRAEQALQLAKDELETQVMLRTAELSEANRQLQVELGVRKRAEEKLVYTTLHDPLTNLSNRVLFMDHLRQAMERTKRNKDYEFAVLFLDLDRFKVVNDSLGHNVGDMLLIKTAHRLAKCMRAVDTVARLGGDEFVILLEDIQDPLHVTRVADRILHDLALPHDLDGHKVFVGVSMGILLSKPGYEQPEELLRDADIAMYRAKGQGRGRYEMFDTKMLVSATTRLGLEIDLRKALERKEFVIHYQPIVELGNEKIVGFEALMRWQHPERGLVSPAEFIPTAEETGLIIPMGYWALEEACRQVREWQIRYPSDSPLTISVNLSARQCTENELVQRVSEILEKTGLNASDLKLELTESMIVEDAESTAAVLSELRNLGVQVQIDDFGTGYSSLGYLQKLPIDTLKIDRTFINRMGKGGSGSDIVRTIMALAHDLGMKVVAEGVETNEQLSKLKSMQCEYGQGYFFTKPVDSQSAEALLEKPQSLIEVH